MLIYLISSLKNNRVREVAARIRAGSDWEVFDDWHCAGPDADDEWQAYEQERGRHYRDALNSPHAKMVFDFDKRWLDRADAVCLVMPCGKSGHLELGYIAGKGKPCYVLFDEIPDRYDVMYRFCDEVFFDTEELIEELRNVELASKSPSFMGGLLSRTL